MIEIRRSEVRGHADHGWLESFHTFSFGGYRDPGFMGFSDLRVINQDRVRAGRGFGTHGHRDMEIVSWVLDGVLEHEDSLGNGSRMRPGDVQLMSAGTGVTHSEFNGSAEEPLHFMQMWIEPSATGTAPRYQQRHVDASERQGTLRLVISPDGDGESLAIRQDARLLVGLLADGERVVHELTSDRCAWLHLARGNATLNGEALAAGDGAAVRDEQRIELAGIEGAELLLWELSSERLG